MKEWEVALVTEAQSGNSKCFEELYELYHEKVFAVIQTTVKNRADAEDILQQTFLNAWRNLKNLSNPAAFNAWIQRIAINQSYELLRKKNIAILLDSEDELNYIADNTSDEFIPAVYAEREDLRIRLGQIIDGLSEVQRQTVMLYYFNELKVEEIAEVMECSANTVKTRLSLARKSIKNEIEERERKSGQKFYGIAGISVLVLSQVLAGQVEAAALGTSASGAILQNITSTIANEAAVAAQTATGASAVGTTAGTTATGMTLGVKIVIGVIAAAVITAGVILLPKLMESAPEATPNSAITSTMINADNSLLDMESDDNVSESQENNSYYGSLSDEQKLLLSRLEAALRAVDYQTSHDIQRSEEFHALCESIPDKGSFWYNPDEETRAIVYFDQEESASYNMVLYIGTGESGRFFHGKHGGDPFIDYILHETSYSGGKANGAFISYFYHYNEEGGTEFYTFEGNLADGKATEPASVYKEGVPYGYSEAEYHSWWPNWPE